jgi:hypothetical protein
MSHLPAAAGPWHDGPSNACCNFKFNKALSPELAGARLGLPTSSLVLVLPQHLILKTICFIQ